MSASARNGAKLYRVTHVTSMNEFPMSVLYRAHSITSTCVLLSSVEQEGIRNRLCIGHSVDLFGSQSGCRLF